MFDFRSFLERFIARETASSLGRSGGLEATGWVSPAEVFGRDRRLAMSSGVLCKRVVVGAGPGGRRVAPLGKLSSLLFDRWLSTSKLSSGSEVDAPGKLEDKKLLAVLGQSVYPKDLLFGLTRLRSSSTWDA